MKMTDYITDKIEPQKKYIRNKAGNMVREN